MVVAEFGLPLFLALMPVAHPGIPGKAQNPPCEFAMCGLRQDLRAPLFFSLFCLGFFVLFYDTGFPEHPARQPQLLASRSSGATDLLMMGKTLSFYLLMQLTDLLTKCEMKLQFPSCLHVLKVCHWNLCSIAWRARWVLLLNPLDFSYPSGKKKKAHGKSL